MKFYILCSRYIDGLKRHILTIPKEDMVVVINSLSQSFQSEASEYCEKQGIEYHITESNGTPGKGKNSVMNLFLESDNEHMVMVDGDDELTLWGVKLYKHIAENCDVDILCLINQRIFWPTSNISDQKYEWASMFDTKWAEKREADHLEQAETDIVEFHRPSRLFGVIGRDHSYEDMKNWYRNAYRISKDEPIGRPLEKLCRGIFLYYHLSNRYCEYLPTHTERMCRMVFYSRHGAKQINFNEERFIGEDVIEYLKMKALHFQGKIKMYRHSELSRPTYIYNQLFRGLTKAFDPTEGVSEIHKDWLSEDFIKKHRGSNIQEYSYGLGRLLYKMRHQFVKDKSLPDLDYSIY